MMADKREDRYFIRSSKEFVSGIALIINIFTTDMKVDDGTVVTSTREGSLEDVNSLKKMFKYLDFETITSLELTASEIKKKILDFVNKLETIYKDKGMNLNVKPHFLETRHSGRQRRPSP